MKSEFERIVKEKIGCNGKIHCRQAYFALRQTWNWATEREDNAAWQWRSDRAKLAQRVKTRNSKNGNSGQLCHDIFWWIAVWSNWLPNRIGLLLTDRWMNWRLSEDTESYRRRTVWLAGERRLHMSRSWWHNLPSPPRVPQWHGLSIKKLSRVRCQLDCLRVHRLETETESLDSTSRFD